MKDDLLDMAFINSLPQPFHGRMYGEGLGAHGWPIHDIEVQTGLVRIDVCGLLELKTIADFSTITDAYGLTRNSEAFYTDATAEERLPVMRDSK